MRRKKILYVGGVLTALCLVSCGGLWFAFFRPIIPKGNVGERKFETRTDEQGREYEIGVYFVLENRSNPGSRVIPVDYCRFLAENETGPPIFLLPGGPGNKYVGTTPDLWKIPYFEKLRAFSDVVLVNQRGHSKPRRDILTSFYMGSAPKPDSGIEFKVKDFEGFAKFATARYEKSDVDLSGYNIIECAADIDDLRKALGYDKVMLMGQSFGSQWSFAIMRNHPEIVERAILTGVEPLNHTYDMPSHVMSAVRRIWAHIDTAPAWQPYLPPGGMEEAAETVLTQLENGVIEVKGADGKTKVILGPEDFPWNNPGEILELFHGHVTRWEKGRERTHYGNWPLIHPLIDSSIGVTADRREQLLNDPNGRYVPRDNGYFASLDATAEIWPSPDVGDEFRTPIQCDIPVVFIHGNWDRNTPIENTLEIAPFFPNSHTLQVDRGGHSGMHDLAEHPDVMTALMEFAETGSLDGIPNSVAVEADLGRSGKLPHIDPATLSK